MIYNSNSEKVLGVTFDNKLTFKEHIDNLCRKANQKLHALGRIANYMSFKQRKTIMNAFISSQFNYCPLVWLCHNRSLNSQINNIHHRALSIVYNDYISSFESLLEKSGSFSIHHKNIQLLAIEVYKTINGLSPLLMSDIFVNKSNRYNLRSGQTLKTFIPKTSNYGVESVSYLASKIWNLVPIEIKNSKSLEIFKNKIKIWKPTSCPCRLCKLYISNLGYI